MKVAMDLSEFLFGPLTWLAENLPKNSDTVEWRHPRDMSEETVFSE